MKKTKLAVSILAVLMATLLLAACGGGTASSAAATGDSAAAPAATGDSAAAPAEGGGKTIVYWSMWDSTEPQAIALQKAIDAYQTETGNTVDVQFKGRTGIREGLEPALDAGTTIDMFDEDIDRVNGMWGKYLLDIEDMAAAVDYDATAIPGLMSACRDAGGGTLKSIPYQPNVFNFFYNQQIFTEAGVTEVPATWDDFLAACEKIKAAGYIPITCDDAYILCMLGYHMGRIAGEDAVIDIVTNGNWAENPAALQAAQAYEELATKGYFSPNIASNVWPAGQNGEFALGEVAMYLNGSWLPNEVRSITGDEFEWGCFSYPAVEGGQTGTEAANYGAQVLAINNKSEVAQEAFDLICYFTKGEYDNMLAQESLGIPADTTNSEWPAQLAAVKPVMESLSTRWTWAVGIETNADMTPVIKENLLKLCGGTMTAQQFIDTLEAAG